MHYYSGSVYGTKYLRDEAQLVSSWWQARRGELTNSEALLMQVMKQMPCVWAADWYWPPATNVFRHMNEIQYSELEAGLSLQSPKFIKGQSTWDYWWAYWHFGRSYSEHLESPNSNL